MKKFLIAILFLISIHSYGQSLMFNPTFSNSDYNHFKNPIGLEIAYFHPIKKRAQLGISFNQNFFHKTFSYNYSSLNDGKSYDRTVKAKNNISSITLSFEIDLLRKKNSSLFLGPMISLNNLERDELILDVLSEKISNTISASTINKTKPNRLGTGLNFKFHQRLNKQFGIFAKIDPAVIFYRNPDLVGTPDPSIISLTNFGIGINYNFQRK